MGLKRSLFFVDDHPLVLAGLENALIGVDDLRIDGVARSRNQAKHRLRIDPLPDLTLLDIQLPDGSVFALLEELQTERRSFPFAILTSSRDWDHLRRAGQLGARGYLLKDSEPLEILSAVRKMISGERLFPDFPVGVQVLPEELILSFHKLTEREKELLRYISKGFMNREIAEMLGISLRTVEAHRANAAEKLGVKGSMQFSTILVQLRDLLDS